MKRNASFKVIHAALGLSTLISAVAPATLFAETDAPTVHIVEAPAPKFILTAGRSRVLAVEFDVTRLAITNPSVADATLGSEPRQILIDGKGAGTVSLIVWGPNQRAQYDVVVEPPATALQQQLQAVFPKEEIHANVSDEVVVLTGRVSSAQVGMRAVQIAQASNAKLRVVNMLSGLAQDENQQVMLEVRFAEVNRTALQEMAANLLASREKWSGTSTTEQTPAPFIDASKPAPIQVPDFLNLFFSLNKEGILGTIKALQQRGSLQTLAEPNLIAYNGKEASFLAGGEFPVPIAQGGSNGAISVQWKEFGVRLKFTPTIVGDTIRLKVRPEVSSLDFANGIRLSGFQIPALTSRWAETDVELRDGQSFAIAGLLNNTAQDQHSQVPWLGSIPIVGTFFKSKSESSVRTELLVLITPHLVRPLEPTEVPKLPVDPRRFIKSGDGLGSALEGGGGLVDGPPVAPTAPTARTR